MVTIERKGSEKLAKSSAIAVDLLMSDRLLDTQAAAPLQYLHGIDVSYKATHSLIPHSFFIMMLTHNPRTRIRIIYQTLGLLFIFLGCSGLVHPGHGHAVENFESPNFEGESLNIRMSTQAILPPKALIKKQLAFPDISIASPFIGPPPKTAILESDAGHRVAILAINPEGRLTVHVLQDDILNVPLSPLRACTEHRQCATDRRPLTGGLGCVAICFQDLLRLSSQP